jgi:hypothetical protein
MKRAATSAPATRPRAAPVKAASTRMMPITVALMTPMIRRGAGSAIDGRGEAKTFRPNVGNLAVKQLMDELSDEYLFTVIKKGGAAVGKNAAMPAWSAQLGDDDIRDVVAFVRTLSRR